MKHTIGPWHRKYELTGVTSIYGGGEEIARVMGEAGGIQEANANIIKEAPEMLKAIKNAIKTGDLPAETWNELTSIVNRIEG